MGKNYKMRFITKSRVKIRKGDILLPLFIFIVFVLFPFNTGNADYKNYEMEYYNIAQGKGSGYFEPVFFSLAYICGQMKFSYSLFFGLVATASIILTVKGLRYFTNQRVLTYAIYIIYPFLYDVVQYRNTLAYAICIWGLHYIMYLKPGENKKLFYQSVWKYVVCVLIAMGIHASAIVYMVLLLIPVVQSTKRTIFISLIAFVGVTVIAASFARITSLLNALNLTRYVRYGETNNYSTFYQYMLLGVFQLGLGTIRYRKNLNDPRYRFLLLVTTFIPFIIMSGSAARMIRNMYILIYAIILWRPVKTEWYVEWLIVGGLAAAAVFVFYSQLSSGFYYDAVTEPVLTENSVLLLLQ